MLFSLRPAVCELLRSGAGFVVAANERTARLIRRAWEAQEEQDEGTREQAPVVSWRGLQGRLWDRLLVAGAAATPVLSREQEERLWGRAIAASGAARGVRAMPEMAARAAARLQEFRAETAFRGLRLPEESDAAVFAGWKREVERWAAELGWVSEAELPGRLADAVRAGRLVTKGQTLALVGFAELVPAQRGLLSAWVDAGGRVLEERFGWESPDGTGRVCGAETTEEELRLFTRWAAERMRLGDRSVALIVPNAAAERDGIEAVLRAGLETERRGLDGAATETPRFEFALGRPLLQEPMVRTALDLLRLMSGDLSMERVGPLLRSPYVAGEQFGRESHARAALYPALLRRHRRMLPEIGLAELQGAALHRVASVPGLHAAIDGMAKERGTVERRLQRTRERGAADGALEYAAWAEVFADWLRVAGWGPAARPQSSREFQVRRRWERLVDRFAALSFDGAAVPWAEALEQMEWMAAKEIFAPESRDAPVQVMGAREAAGCCFDAVWVMGADASRWPMRGEMLPLLPRSLQEEFGMPGADAARDRMRGEELAERLLRSGAEVVFSYAKERDAETGQTLAGAVRRLELPELDAAAMGSAWEEPATIEAEVVEDGEAVAPLREGVLQGGASVLQLQAACGFRAFAEVRLGAKQEAAPQEGLNAKERGTVVHAAMDRLWEALECQQTLAEMPAEEQDRAAGAAVREALTPLRAGAQTAWEREMLLLLERRMTQLVRRWMEHELQRPRFRVERQETETAVRIGGLLLTLRVDRVDVDEETGGRLVLDYKTGQASPSAWEGERPDQPQLPLYAVALSRAAEQEGGQPVAGVTFAMLRPGDGMKLAGVAEAGLLPGGNRRKDADRSFGERVREWAEALEGLAAEFAAGQAHVRPKSFPGSCERCGQRVLCRVSAADFDASEDDEADGQDHG